MKEMGADELIGPRSIPAMKAGKVERVMDGFLPKAHIGYLDEVFKGSPPVLNAILDLQANRQLKVGGKVVSAKQLILIIGSSNELPDREDLMAFRDRWGVTKFVQPVRCARRQAPCHGDPARGAVRRRPDRLLEHAEARAGRSRAGAGEAMAVAWTPCYDAMLEAQEKWEGAGHPPSQRRIGQIIRVMKARAWTKGRGELHT
jgi:MoxR-like ATPase